MFLLFRSFRLLAFVSLFVCFSVSLCGAQESSPEEDSAATQQIRALLEQPVPLESFSAGIREDLQTLYRLRGDKPAWNTDPKADKASLNGFVDSVKNFTAYHGLSSKDYPLKEIKALIAGLDGQNRARLEVTISAWLLMLAHDLNGDRVNLAHLYPGWDFARPRRRIAEELAQAIDEDKVEDYFKSLAPKNIDYMRLADALKQYRDFEKEHGAFPSVSPGPTIRPGQRDPRVAQIRARLLAEGYVLPEIYEGQNEEDFYTDKLEAVVIAYQSRNGLDADGNVGAKTVAAMDVPLSRRIGQIVANMERLRHLPDAWPDRYARVNSADATVKVFDQGNEIYHAAVVLGRPDRKTPFIRSAIRSVIFNPSWHVPTKIARKDILPKLRRDPHYLEKMGMVINGSADDPYGETINWHAIKESEFTFRLRQSPGDANSLGRIKFDFDNDFSVYMHGTPHQELFGKAERHHSSGCVRLKDPDVMAKIVLAHNEGDWSLPSIQEQVDRNKTRWLKVADPLPLFILYDTAFFPTPDSKLNFRDDIYGYDQLLLSYMNEERGRS